MCAERLELLFLYDEAVEAFAATSDLKRLIDGECTPGDFARFRTQATARLVSLRAAKLAFWEHRQRHGC